jgi:lipopolysaccharide/colanic/teichoic acid biosynthesis glycosyltransferase
MKNKAQRPPRGHNGNTGPRGIIDRFLALVVLLVSSPVMVITAICISLESPGGAIFRQERVGWGGRKFTMYKFRSMRGTTDDEEYRQLLRTMIQEDRPHVDYKLSFQPRVTRVGAILRKTNLDELPQLFNVLKGDLRLVGPRPDLPYSVEAYEEWMHKRLLVKPGMTGLWQVSGGNHLSFHQMVRLDIEYIERQSMLLDVRILLKTAMLVIRRDGNYWSKNGQKSQPTEDKVIESSAAPQAQKTRVPNES